MGEVNKTEEQHHTWTDEQIHILLSTVADLHQRVASLETGSKHSVSNVSHFMFSRVVENTPINKWGSGLHTEYLFNKLSYIKNIVVM